MGCAAEVVVLGLVVVGGRSVVACVAEVGVLVVVVGAGAGAGVGVVLVAAAVFVVVGHDGEMDMGDVDGRCGWMDG